MGPRHDNHTFSPEIWATVLQVIGDDERISIETAAKMRGFRIAEGPKLNPEGFKMSSEDLRFSAIETALYLRVFGRGTEGGAETRWVRVMFGEFFSFFFFVSLTSGLMTGEERENEWEKKSGGDTEKSHLGC